MTLDSRRPVGVVRSPEKWRRLILPVGVTFVGMVLALWLASRLLSTRAVTGVPTPPAPSTQLVQWQNELTTKLATREKDKEALTADVNALNADLVIVAKPAVLPAGATAAAVNAARTVALNNKSALTAFVQDEEALEKRALAMPVAADSWVSIKADNQSDYNKVSGRNWSTVAATTLKVKADVKKTYDDNTNLMDVCTDVVTLQKEIADANSTTVQPKPVLPVDHGVARTLAYLFIVAFGLGAGGCWSYLAWNRGQAVQKKTPIPQPPLVLKPEPVPPSRLPQLEEEDRAKAEEGERNEKRIDRGAVATGVEEAHQRPVVLPGETEPEARKPAEPPQAKTALPPVIVPPGDTPPDL